MIYGQRCKYDLERENNKAQKYFNLLKSLDSCKGFVLQELQ